MYQIKKNIGLIILLAIIAVFVVPFLIFWLGWIAGWIATWVIGGPLVEGFNALGIPIESNQIPIITGTIAWVGSIFGTNKIISYNKKED